QLGRIPGDNCAQADHLPGLLIVFIAAVCSLAELIQPDFLAEWRLIERRGVIGRPDVPSFGARFDRAEVTLKLLGS
ncbi:MAG TPA: hypothetical protein VF353_12820, partial [Candidatus Binatia bacterium]